MANGFCTSAPAPLLNAIGIKPREATAAVIKIGLNLVFVAVVMMSTIVLFGSIANLFISVNNTMPFNTATPNNAINPTPADILNGIPLNHSASTPPMAEKGIAEKINKQCFKLLKAKNNITKINSSATGTAICNRLTACSKFSNCPP